MAIRKLEYLVTADGTGLLPSSIQWGGIQYEDNATTVEYSIDSAYLTELEKNGKLLYRIDFNSPGAAYSPSQNLEMVDGKISRDIPYEITQYGGQMQSVLVVTTLNENDGSTVIVLSLPGTIRFTAVPKKASDVIKRLSAYEEHVEDLIKEIYSVLGDSEESTEEANKLLESIKTRLENGEFDGYSPSIDLSEQDNGVLLTVTDREGVETKLIKHGSKGDKGDTGEQGLKGDKGEPGEVTLQYANNTFANCLKGNKTATGSLTLDDVSPIEHELKIKVSSKNLINVATDTIYTSMVGGFDFERTETGIKMIAKRDITGSWDSFGFNIGKTADMKGKTYTVSINKEMFNSTISGNTVPRFSAEARMIHPQYPDYIGNASQGITIKGTTSDHPYIFTIPQDIDAEAYPYVFVKFVFASGGNVVTGDYTIYGDIMVEEGATKTNYSPYVNVSDWTLFVTDGGEVEDEGTQYQTLTINEDGTVDGAKSYYPTTFVWDNAEGETVIECEYNRDTNKMSSGSVEWKLLGEYKFKVSDRKLVVYLSQFDATHFRILGTFPKCAEACGILYASLGSEFHQSTGGQYTQNTYALNFLAECELYDKQLYGYLGFTNGWALNIPTTVAMNTPRDNSKSNRLSFYYANAVTDSTENTIQIWGY